MKGTIFEKTLTTLTLWFYAFYLFSISNFSGHELEQILEVNYKTAYKIKKQIKITRQKKDSKEYVLFGKILEKVNKVVTFV